MPTLEELEHLYTAAWKKPQSEIEMTGATERTLAEAYAKKLAGSLGRKDLAGLKILDYGAGRGDVLATLKALGADVFAVEPFGEEFLRKRGFPTFSEVEAIPPGLRFDGVVMIDVVEHVAEPRVLLSRLKEKLRRPAWIYLATPNAASLRARIQGARWGEALNPVHLFLYTPRSLTLLLDGSGFEKVTRLRWMIRYPANPLRRLLHMLLQLLGIDGELRYMAQALR